MSRMITLALATFGATVILWIAVNWWRPWHRYQDR